MSYMLLIVEPTEQRVERGVEAGQRVYAQMLKFTEDLQSKGLLVASNSLASTKQAVRVQVRQGRSTLIDGPFTEAKEMIGGFFLLNCDTREEAIAIAEACPAAAWCSVEVRRVGPCYE